MWRLLNVVPTAFIVSIVVFLLLRLLPGDPAEVIGGPDASLETLATIRHDLGLDLPLPVQYGIWMSRMVVGDFGTSIVNGFPVSNLILSRLTATMELAVAATLASLIIGIPVGVTAALRHRRVTDWFVTAITGVAMAIPSFWLGILGIFLFSIILKWLPPGGRVDFVQNWGLALKSLILPAMTLSLIAAAGLSRIVRSTMLEVLHEDYIRTAEAKGLDGITVVIRHALRNALVPIVTVSGLTFGNLLTGTVITETVFNWPGIGKLLVDSINNRDYQVVQAIVLIIVTIYIVVNLVTDVAYGLIDPRIRLGEKDAG